MHHLAVHQAAYALAERQSLGCVTGHVYTVALHLYPDFVCHVDLQVEADRPYVPPSAAQIRPQLVQAVTQRRFRAAAQELLNKSRIELR